MLAALQTLTLEGVFLAVAIIVGGLGLLYEFGVLGRKASPRGEERP